MSDRQPTPKEIAQNILSTLERALRKPSELDRWLGRDAYTRQEWDAGITFLESAVESHPDWGAAYIEAGG